MTERTIRTYQLKIKAAWQKQVSGIIETGQLLIKAKAALEHGEWGKLFEGDDKLPFGQDTASKLMKVARHPVLSNSEFTLNLPPSWFSLSVLAQLPQQQLERHIAEGTITAETTQEEAIALVRQGPRTTGDPRPLSPADEEFQRDLDRLMKVTEIARQLTLEPPWENDGFRAGLKRYLLERRFLPAESISEEIECAITFLSKTLQLVRQIKAEVATHGSDAPVVRIVQTLEASEAK